MRVGLERSARGRPLMSTPGLFQTRGAHRTLLCRLPRAAHIRATRRLLWASPAHPTANTDRCFSVLFPGGPPHCARSESQIQLRIASTTDCPAGASSSMTARARRSHRTGATCVQFCIAQGFVSLPGRFCIWVSGLVDDAIRVPCGIGLRQIAIARLPPLRAPARIGQ